MTENTKINRVLVTGAEGALGRYVVCDLVRRGYDVIGTCFKDQAVAEMGRHEPNALGFLVADLAEEGDVERLASTVASEFGGIDAVIHTAGGFRYTKVEDATLKDFEFLMAANWKSAFLISQKFLPQMRAQNRGRLVFVSSRSATDAAPGMGLYAGSKLALNALIVSLAKELAGTGITVNGVAPTIIDTPANREAMPDADRSQWVTRGHIMECIEHFLGPDGGHVSGAIWGLGFSS